MTQYQSVKVNFKFSNATRDWVNGMRKEPFHAAPEENSEAMRSSERGAALKPADEKIIRLTELRFKPANSNDAARAVLSHHFSQVPKCSFAKDDGISQYLGSETGMQPAPVSPREHVALHEDVPAIASETADGSRKSRFKLLREAFAAALLLHAIAAFAIFYVKVPLPKEASLVEGVTVISLVVDAENDAAQRASGDKDPVKEPVEEPVEKPIAVEIKNPVEKPVEKPAEPVRLPEPVQAKTEEILNDLPIPALGAAVPEILAARDDAMPKAEIAAPLPVEEPIEQPQVKEITAVIPEKKLKPEVKPEPGLKTAEPLPHPVSKPRDVKKVMNDKPKPVEKKPEEKKPEEKKPEPKKEELKKKPEKKKKPEEKRQTVKGNRGKDASDTTKGRKGAKDKKSTADDSSRGASNNREIGNAARSNYKGLIEKKLARAKSRVRNPGSGKVTVAFTITANGDVSGLRITRSSGNEKIDAAALKIVDKAAPFPAIPAEAGGKSLPMSMPVWFK
jgi:protein TonB